MKTYMKKKEDITSRRCYLIDAENRVLGRLSTKIAILLMGKDSPEYSSHVDSGATVIVINADKIKVSGKKQDNKEYKNFSGYPGGQRVRTFKDVLKIKPESIIRHAVKGMLPKNKLQARRIARLKIYCGQNHPHQAQNPTFLEVS